MATMNPFYSALLQGAANYLGAEKPAIIAAIQPPADKGIDAVAAAVKGAVPKYMAAFIDHAIDTLDAESKAAVPTEAGAFIDYIVARLEALAAS